MKKDDKDERKTIKLYPEVHRQLKILAAQSGESINTLIDRLVKAEQQRAERRPRPRKEG
jgi:predicted HicB family RNase H-like nuclease